MIEENYDFGKFETNSPNTLRSMIYQFGRPETIWGNAGKIRPYCINRDISARHHNVPNRAYDCFAGYILIKTLCVHFSESTVIF